MCKHTSLHREVEPVGQKKRRFVSQQTLESSEHDYLQTEQIHFPSAEENSEANHSSPRTLMHITNLVVLHTNGYGTSTNYLQLTIS